MRLIRRMAMANHSEKAVIKLGPSEATALVMVMLGTKIFLGYPRMVTQLGATAGWLIILLSCLTSIGFWRVIASLLARFPGRSLLEISELVLGRPLGFGLNIIIILYTLLGSSMLMRQFADTVILTALPNTPISALSALFLVTIFVAAYLGLEALSRSAFIALPFLIGSTLAVLIPLYPFWDMKELYPILGTGAWPVLKYSFLNTSAFGEVLILAFLAPYFSFGPDGIKRAGTIAIVVTAVFFILITVVYIMVMPMPGAMENLAPFFQLSRSIYLGRYYQRLESFFILFWTFTAFMRLAIGYVVTALIIQQALKLPYYRPLLPALAVLIFSLALTFPDALTTISIEKEYRLLYGWIFTFILPCGVWAAAYLLKKDDKNGLKN